MGSTSSPAHVSIAPHRKPDSWLCLQLYEVQQAMSQARDEGEELRIRAQEAEVSSAALLFSCMCISMYRRLQQAACLGQIASHSSIKLHLTCSNHAFECLMTDLAWHPVVHGWASCAELHRKLGAQGNFAAVPADGHEYSVVKHTGGRDAAAAVLTVHS